MLKCSPSVCAWFTLMHTTENAVGRESVYSCCSDPHFAIHCRVYKVAMLYMDGMPQNYI